MQELEKGQSYLIGLQLRPFFARWQKKSTFLRIDCHFVVVLTKDNIRRHFKYQIQIQDKNKKKKPCGLHIKVLFKKCTYKCLFSMLQTYQNKPLYTPIYPKHKKLLCIRFFPGLVYWDSTLPILDFHALYIDHDTSLGVH